MRQDYAAEVLRPNRYRSETGTSGVPSPMPTRSSWFTSVLHRNRCWVLAGLQIDDLHEAEQLHFQVFLNFASSYSHRDLCVRRMIRKRGLKSLTVDHRHAFDRDDDVAGFNARIGGAGACSDALHRQRG